MAKTFDFTQKRIDKLLSDKSAAQEAFEQLITEMKQGQQSTTLCQHFCLKAFLLESDEDLLVLLDDFLVTDLKTQWHIHLDTARIKTQFRQRLSTYSEAKMRRMLSHTVVDKQLEYTQLPSSTIAWLFGDELELSSTRVIPFDSNLKAGFLVLGLTKDSVPLTSQGYAFLGEAVKILLDRFLN